MTRRKITVDDDDFDDENNDEEDEDDEDNNSLPASTAPLFRYPAWTAAWRRFCAATSFRQDTCITKGSTQKVS